MSTHEVLKPFPYSHDGVTARHAERGAVVHDLPAGSVPGLVREGFVREAKAISRSPENKMLTGAPENKASADDLDDDSEGLSRREIDADLTAMSIDFDPRDSREELLAQRDEGRAERATAPTPKRAYNRKA